MKHQFAELVIIGGGTAGAVVAAKLAGAGMDTALVEAGPDYGPLAGGAWPSEILDAAVLATTHDWGYTSGPVSGREPWTWERARILGGCAAHNGAIAPVGTAPITTSGKFRAGRPKSCAPVTKLGSLPRPT